MMMSMEILKNGVFIKEVRRYIRIAYLVEKDGKIHHVILHQMYKSYVILPNIRLQKHKKYVFDRKSDKIMYRNTLCY